MSGYYRRRGKYNSKHVKIDGLSFDSKAEVVRWGELSLLLSVGEISNLKHHPKFKLIVSGALICTYEADSSYFEKGHHHEIVEDVKGYPTRDYILKRKLFQALYPHVEFREVKA